MYNSTKRHLFKGAEVRPIYASQRKMAGVIFFAQHALYLLQADSFFYKLVCTNNQQLTFNADCKLSSLFYKWFKSFSLFIIFLISLLSPSAHLPYIPQPLQGLHSPRHWGSYALSLHRVQLSCAAPVPLEQQIYQNRAFRELPLSPRRIPDSH